jgi:hypothetical protein
MAGFDRPKWLSGARVSFAGEFPYGWNLGQFISAVESCDGIYQRSPINCHLLVCGEDAGDRPMRARDSNPDVFIWTLERFADELRRAKLLPDKHPWLFPQFITLKHESYGSF